MALTITSAVVSSDGRSITLTFNDDAVGTSVPTTALLTATFGGTALATSTTFVKSKTSDAFTTRTVVYQLNRVIRIGEVLTISGGAGLVVCPSGSSLAFTGFAVTNNSTQWLGIYLVKEGAAANGDGSYATPYGYLDDLPTVMQPGDEVHFWGDVGFRPAAGGGYAGNVRAWTVNHLVLRVAEGAGYGCLVGYKNIAAGSMTYNGGTKVATVNIGAGRSVAGVAVNYSYATLATGRVWFGFTKPAPNAAAVGTAGYEDGFFYDSGTGLLTFGVAFSGVDPNSQPTGWVKWFEGNYKAAIYVAGNHCRVLGLNTNGHLDTAAGNGYPIKIAGYGGQITGGQFSMSGYHGPCFVSEDPAYPLGNFDISNCTYEGAGGGSSPTLIAIYGNTGVVRGGRIRACNFLMYTPIGVDGATALYTSSCSGVYCHTDGSVGQIGDVEITDCVFQSVQGNPGWPAAASNCAAPGDIYDWRTWAVRARRCRTVDTIRGLFSNDKNASFAWVQSDLDYLQYGPNTSVSGATAVWENNTAANLGDSYFGFFGTCVRWDGKDSMLNTRSNTPALFFTSSNLTGSTMTFVSVNSSFVECSSTSPNPPAYCGVFSVANRGCRYRVRNSVFAFRHAPGGSFNYLLLSDGNLAGSPYGDHDFAGNFYEKVDVYSQKTGLGTQTQWSTNIDTAAKGAIFSAGASFANLPTDVSFSTTAAIYASRTVQPQYSDGVNDRAFSGAYGAWQLGPKLNSTGTSARVVQSAYRRAGVSRTLV